jgi:TonB-dependent receptor
VTGQRASLRKGIATQSAANNIVSAVSADDIGGLPDRNAAEALARMPGLSVQRDQGEGRYVVVRGLAPEFNSVTINGALVPSPEQSTRAVSLDVIPAGLIGAIEVQKTLTPDRDANSLGGTIDIKTLTAFDLPAAGLLSGTLAGSYNENAKKTSPSASLLWAARYLDGHLGVAAGLSTEKRQFGSDDIETGGQWSNGRLAGWNMRDYHPTRERHALGMNLDWRPQAGEAYYLHTLLSRFSDSETRDQMVISNFSGGNPAEGETRTARVERRLRDRKYTREIQSAEAGGERSFDEWELRGAIGASHANEDTPDQLSEAIFRYSNVAGIGFTNTETPTLIAPASLYDTGKFKLNSLGFQQRTSRDRENHARLDAVRKLDVGEVAADVQFGIKSSRRKKTNDTQQWSVATSGLPATLTSYTGAQADYPFGNIGLGIDPALVWAAVTGKAQVANVAKSAVSDYAMDENIDAAYAMASISAGNWNVLVGGRSERTAFTAAGYQVNVSGSITPTAAAHTHQNFLPTLQARLDAGAGTSLRAAVTQAVVRPNFNQLTPGVTLSSSTEASFGNPDLLPLKSTNLDLGVERLLGRDGSVSAYVFDKDIKNFTYSTNLAGTGQWVGYTTATGYANGDKARIGGVELAYSQALRTLPEPWDGLILGVNAMVSRSTATVGRYDSASSSTLNRDIDMPGHSRRLYNLSLGYEKGPASTRLAVNYKSPYLLALGADILDSSADQIVDAQRQFDFSFKLQFDKAVQLSFEAINITNQAYYVYQGSRPYNVQYERYGRTYRLGLAFTL